MLLLILMIIIIFIIYNNSIEMFSSQFKNKCSSCESMSNDICQSCSNCGVCTSLHGDSKCVSGDANGPYFDQCFQWTFGHSNNDSDGHYIIPYTLTNSNYKKMNN